MRAGSRKASDSVMRMERGVRFSRPARSAMSLTDPLTSASSQDRAVAIVRISRLRSSDSIGRLGAVEQHGSRRARRTRDAGLVQGTDNVSGVLRSFGSAL
jgi:hypothetical protein